MKRLFFVVSFFFLLAACSDPRQALLPNDLQQWETDQEFQAAFEKLLPEEQRIISTYLIRVTLEELNGELAPEGLTIAEAIQLQQIFIAEWREEQDAKKRAAAAIVRFKEDYRNEKVDVVDFEIAKKKSGAQIIQAACGAIVNKGDKPLCDLELTVYFLDKHGYKISERVYYPIKAIREKMADGKEFVFDPEKRIRFSYPIIENIPPNWNGMASAQITKIEFDESSEVVAN